MSRTRLNNAEYQYPEIVLNTIELNRKKYSIFVQVCEFILLLRHRTERQRVAYTGNNSSLRRIVG